ncbi:hypothetical protein MtrunA17_Chr7g0255091 [Medicago truncatula]|uniref:Transmembrane protein, putative n=1 Tax=Medicago truncatula TaxID=3880 RepID=G7L3T2_MEDTR|nr:transmembrane protein, putative [Medicago truncatula]RHN47633.1 hypothetical protein MtrunA17_Chr7g0255091 [Medicago truncatula]
MKISKYIHKVDDDQLVLFEIQSEKESGESNGFEVVFNDSGGGNNNDDEVLRLSEHLKWLGLVWSKCWCGFWVVVAVGIDDGQRKRWKKKKNNGQLVYMDLSYAGPIVVVVLEIERKKK